MICIALLPSLRQPSQHKQKHKDTRTSKHSEWVLMQKNNDVKRIQVQSAPFLILPLLFVFFSYRSFLHQSILKVYTKNPISTTSKLLFLILGLLFFRSRCRHGWRRFFGLLRHMTRFRNRRCRFRFCSHRILRGFNDFDDVVVRGGKVWRDGGALFGDCFERRRCGGKFLADFCEDVDEPVFVINNFVLRLALTLVEGQLTSHYQQRYPH